jgi:hypothetical protein
MSRYAGKMDELRRQRGNRCEDCGRRARLLKDGNSNLEFSHLKPTGLFGKGRGRANRYHNIKKFPGHYRLRCRQCHRLADLKGMADGYQESGAGVVEETASTSTEAGGTNDVVR